MLASFWSGRADEDANAYLMDAPGPLAPLFGVRVEETDSAEPGVANPVTLTDGADEVVSAAQLVFEVLVPEGADVVGTYGTEFYAGTPAVTRHRPGGADDGGEAWYVATGLDFPDALAAARQFTGTQQAVLEQMVLADFIGEGHFERHVRRMRAAYAERQRDLIDALRTECDGLVEAAPAGSGMHLVGWLPPDVDDADVSRRAGSRGG